MVQDRNCLYRNIWRTLYVWIKVDAFCVTQCINLVLQTLNKVEFSFQVIKLLGQILTNWPKQDTFPILNIICCNVVREGIPKESTSLLYKLFKSHKMLSKDSPPTRMCLRILVNCFAKESSRSVMLQNREELIGDLNSFLEEADNEISPQVILLRSREEKGGIFDSRKNRVLESCSYRFFPSSDKMRAHTF